MISVLVSGAASVPSLSADSRARTTARVSAPEKCASARKGIRFYAGRYAEHRKRMGAGRVSIPAALTPACPHVRTAARIWKSRAWVARQAAEYYATVRILRDFEVTPGSSAWHRAVEETQRAYPGTENWLLSCSSSEGGHGRWVPNSQGSGVGGWLQYYPSTFYGFYAQASKDIRSRGFRVPESASSWYSPLGQALAGGWAITHGMRHHWHGAGC